MGSWPPACEKCGAPMTGWTTLFCSKDCRNQAVPMPVDPATEKTQPYPCPHAKAYSAMGSNWCVACGRMVVWKPIRKKWVTP